MRLAVVAALTLAATACATPIDQVEYSSSSDKALVLVETPRQRIYSGLAIGKIDPTTGKFTGRIEEIPATGPGYAPYIATKVSPGSYVVFSYTEQRHWAACFHAETVEFELLAGKVNFLGRFSSQKHSLEIAAEAAAKNRTSSQYGTNYFFYDNMSAPEIEPAMSGSPEAENAAEFVRRFMPQVTAEMELAKVKTVAFEPERTLIGTRSCFGDRTDVAPAT